MTNRYQEKAVMYLRVSSIKQEDGYSLDAQEKMATEYASRNNLEVVRSWKVQESAWGKTERTNFTEMIEYLKRNPNVKHVIFDVVDRMTRNDADKIRIITLIKEYDKTIHFARNNSQPLNKYTLDSNKEFMMDVEVAAAKKLSNDIACKTKMGMTEKAAQGIYPAKAPIGYKNTINQNKEAIITLDEVAAPLITELFQYASTGKYSLEEMSDLFYARGLRTKFGAKRVTWQLVAKILHNPFYYGVFSWGKKTYQGSHIPLVSKALWDKVQKALLAKAHRFDTKHNYPFNRLITCEHCGHSILGVKAKGRYLYYRCGAYSRTHKKGYVRATHLLEKLSGIIKDIELPPAVIKVLIKGLRKRGVDAAHISANHKAVLTQELEKVNIRLDNLLNMRLDNKIDDGLYNQKRSELVNEKTQIEGKLSLCSSKAESVERALSGLEILSGLEKSYQQADDYGKADLLRCVGAKFVLTKENEIAVEYKEPFKGIYEAKMNNGGEGETSPSDKKTALLNKGCLNLYRDKTDSKSCRKNDWGG